MLRTRIFRLARDTGRRIYPILCLRFEDLELERTPSAPWGAIVWPRDMDKQRRRAEVLAGSKRQKREAYHAYRRSFATKRRHLPAKDVAAAGGWKSTFVVQEIYQQADDETLLRVMTEGAELREVG